MLEEGTGTGWSEWGGWSRIVGESVRGGDGGSCNDGGSWDGKDEGGMNEWLAYDVG